MSRRDSIALISLLLFAVDLGLPPDRAAFAAVPTRTIALSGRHAPGTPNGAMFASFADPTYSTSPMGLDDAGHVVFRANLAQGSGGVTADNDTGIWSEGGGALALLAREGDQAPGTGGGKFT